MNFIEINKNLIPYEFDITLKGETFRLVVNYNYLNDFFTIDLYKNGEILVLGEKIVYARPLFLSCLHKNIPRPYIIPFDFSENTDRVTFENLNEEVFLYLVEDDSDAI